MDTPIRSIAFPLLLVLIVALAGCSSLGGISEETTDTESTTLSPTETVTTTVKNTTTTPASTTEPTPNKTSTKTPTETPSSASTEPFNVTIVAAGSGESHYRMYVDQVRIELGEEADGPDEAENPDSVFLDDPYYAYGFVGDGGVDNYYVNRYSPNETSPSLSLVNNGSVPLKVYVDGELSDTIEPGQNVDESDTESPSTTTPTATPSSTKSDKHELVIEAASGGTSNYQVYGVGQAEHKSNTEKTDKVDEPGLPHIEGITGESAKDVYSIEHDSVTQVMNNGTATLNVYIDGELIRTVQPSQSEKSTQTESETAASTSASTSTDTQTEATTTSTETETETTTASRENMQVVKVEALEREEVSYEFVASGSVTLGGETTSSAQVSGSKGSGTISNFSTDTFLIPEGEEVIEVRNLNGYQPIRVTVDGEEIDVSGGPDVDKSTFDSKSTITVEAVGGNQTEYEFYVTGDPFATDETDGASEAVYPDEIHGEYAVGSVGDGGIDKFEYTGKIESFNNFGGGTLKVSINGKLVATVEPGEFLESGDLQSSE